MIGDKITLFFCRHISTMSVVKKAKTANEGALIQNNESSSSFSSVQLSGHGGEVLGVKFSTDGKSLASCSSDKTIFLWDIYSNDQEDNQNYGVLQGHKGAVLDLKWSRDNREMFSASSDLTVSTWDLESGSRIRKHEGHEDMVNSIDVVKRGTELIISGSDDGTIGIWDPREKEAVNYFQTGNYPVIAVAVDSIGANVYSSGVDSTIKVWDARKTDVPVYDLPGHADCNVTSLQLSPDDQILLSNGMDNTVRTWDVRPFVGASGGSQQQQRALKVYDGAPNGIEQNVLRACWNGAGTRIAAGSSDRTAVIWDVFTRQIVYKLPGHIGSVNDVAFSPIDDNILASASSDGTVIVSSL